MRLNDHTRQRQPWRAGVDVAKQDVLAGRVHGTTPLHRLLDRLDDVRSTGDGHVARCPGHDDRRPSLSISEGRDGRVLVHCFGGCPASDVLAAVGLTLGDLFPQRLPDHRLSLDDRRLMSDRSRLARWRAGWNAVMTETAVIEVAAREIVTGNALADGDVQRVTLAAERISAARVEIAQLDQHGDADHLGPRPSRFFDDIGASHLTPTIAKKEAGK